MWHTYQSMISWYRWHFPLLSKATAEPFLILPVPFCSLGTGSFYIAQAALELMTLLLLAARRWNDIT